MIHRSVEISQSLPPGFHRVRQWGDPVMVKYGFDLFDAATGNWQIGHFQAIRLWNPVTGWGGLASFINLTRDDLWLIRSLQIPSREHDADSKMNWLCGDGKIIFDVAAWEIAETARWGVIALGGNIVQVEAWEAHQVDMKDGQGRRAVAMARLRGFRSTDWGRPLRELVHSGLLHRAYCVTVGNRRVDSPKGEVYCPLFSPLDFDFAGISQPAAFYIPQEWLE